MPRPVATKAVFAVDDERWLGASSVGQLLETFRAAAEIEGVPFAVLAFVLSGPIEERINRARRLTRVCNRMWAHDHYVGSRTEEIACVLLPNATLEQALHYADQLLAEVPMGDISIFSSEVGRPKQISDLLTVRPTWELFAHPLPLWKRAVDLSLGVVLTIASAPLLLALMVLIKLTSRGPVLFRQVRVGNGGQPFDMFKLRTMFADAESERDSLSHHNEQSGAAFKIKSDPRVTPLGQLLRRSSLDELPQLLNVLRGEMSLVGPRPLPATDWEPKDPRHVRRHDVTPGITCTWQVSGRNEIPFDEWMEMDLNYIAHTTFYGDLLILVKTVLAVLTGKGAM